MDRAAVLLLDPKFAFNVGGALRACACFGATDMRWTGDRVVSPRDEAKVAKTSTRFPRDPRKRRFPREERMKAYNSVRWGREERDRPITAMAEELDLVPVAVEIREGSESLGDFVHPDRALYVFGPEDGSIGRASLEACHRFVVIPSVGCLNLAAAVNVVLYDRQRSSRLSQPVLESDEELELVW